MSSKRSSLTSGAAEVFRLLSPRVPDALFLSGLAAFGVGVYQINPHAIWLYAGSVLVWTAFGMAANQKREGGQ